LTGAPAAANIGPVTDTNPDHPRKRTLVRAAAVVAFWTLVGLASAVQSHVVATLEGSPAPVGLSILRSVPVWWFWVPATPAIAWLGRRAQLERRTWGRAVIVHFGASVVVAALHSVWLLGFFTLLGVTAEMTETAAEFARILFLSRLYLDLLTYWAVLGAVHAFDYHDRFQERELRASRLETQLARARLDALRMQLNPHFLFNALNAVSAQVRAGRATVAVSMLSGIGDLLRYVLDCEEEALVPLWQERAFLERYVEIERIRFADRLSVDIELPAELGEARVPSLLLQPLVENAIRHGVAPREGPGRIEVQGRRRGDMLVLSVRDDGVGLDGPGPWPSPVASESAADRGAGDADETGVGGRPPREPVQGPGPPTASAGVGLANTRARLDELYGPAYRFEVRASAGGGTEVEIGIPYREAP
jgi:signal transduction histidine kinase